MTKDKKFRTLLILCAVLVVLGVALLIVKGIDKQQEKMQAEQQTLFEVEFADMTKLSWCNGEDEAFAFYKEDGVWHVEGDADFPVDEASLETIAKVFANFLTNFTIEDAENLSQYGLSKLESYISFETEETEATVYIGGYSTIDSLRYVKYGDDVFLARTDPATYIEDYQLYDFLLAETVPDFIPNLISLSREGTEESFDIVSMNPGVYSYSEDYTYFTTYGKAGYTPLETSSVEAYGSYIQSLDYSNFASYTADDEESLAEFGLDDPEFKLVIQYADTSGEEDEDVTLVLAYGTNGEDYVVRIGDSRVICLLDEDTYLFIRDLDIDEYRPNDLLDIDWDLATSIEVTLDGSRYTFAMADEDSEDEDAPDYTNIRKAINNLGVERYTEDAEIGKLELSLLSIWITKDIRA